MALKKGDVWTGYRSVNIPRERKYSVTFARPYAQYRPTIQLTDYGTNIVYPEIYANKAWERVVDDINDMATLHQGQAGGVFYVNEFKQVIKPIGDGSGVDIYVGEYPDLHFVFDRNGVLIDNGDVRGVRAGDPWPHQKVGIKYHYSAYRGEIWCETPEGNVIRRHSIKAPEELAQALWIVKKTQGGIFYVNEHGYAFAPQNEDDSGPDVYLGRVNMAEWFAKRTEA